MVLVAAVIVIVVHICVSILYGRLCGRLAGTCCHLRLVDCHYLAVMYAAVSHHQKVICMYNMFSEVVVWHIYAAACPRFKHACSFGSK